MDTLALDCDWNQGNRYIYKHLQIVWMKRKKEGLRKKSREPQYLRDSHTNKSKGDWGIISGGFRGKPVMWEKPEAQGDFI